MLTLAEEPEKRLCTYKDVVVSVIEGKYKINPDGSIDLYDAQSKLNQVIPPVYKCTVHDYHANWHYMRRHLTGR